jgi:hypothetical protein
MAELLKGSRAMMTTAEIIEAYNYARFVRSESTGRSEEFRKQLRAGDVAPDFELPDLDGTSIRLSALHGRKHVVLEFGSIT